jgi:hypothetical protein
MMRETFTETEIEALTETITKTIADMRKAKLLSPKAIMQHIGKNRAILKAQGEKLAEWGFTVGDNKETRKLLIWNQYLEMELERKTKIPCDVRWNRR